MSTLASEQLGPGQVHSASPQAHSGPPQQLPMPSSSTAPDKAAPSPQEQKEKALLERLDKRGTLIAASMRKFLNQYWAARQQMLDAARAAELAKLARKGKKGRKSKVPKKDEKPGKAGDKKKVQKTPVQEAWGTFLADLDERINKQKRCSLEDMYRGVEKLSAEERRALACVVVASNNKKVLPTEGQNINSLNIRAAVFAAAAAFDMPVEKATLSSSAGLQLVSQRGASEQQLLHFGFKEADILRVGCSRPDLIALSLDQLEHLQAAGVEACEVLGPGADTGIVNAPRQSQQQLGNQSGASRLRAAGYSAEELLEAGVHTVWDLKQAGYTHDELEDAGVPLQDLRSAGFSSTLGQPTQLLAATLRPLCYFRTQDFPPDTQGTQSLKWSSLMKKQPLAAADSPSKPALKGLAHLSHMQAPKNLMTSNATVSSSAAVSEHADAGQY